MSGATWTLPYKPRKWFVDFHARNQRNAIIVAHRQLGKTEAALADLITKCLRSKWREFRPSSPGKFGYVAPLKNQARNITWLRLKTMLLDCPGVTFKESTLEVHFPNGTILRLAGADDPETIRGEYWDGVILDECGDISQEFWQTLSPALRARNGWVVFLGTPKGKNSFYRRWIKAQSDKRWFKLMVKASESGVLSEDQIEAIKEDCDYDEDFIAQELECSFEAAIKGSYFGKQMVQVQDRGQIRLLDYTHEEDVNCAMDIGHRDATAIWFWQVVNGTVKVIKYFEETGKDADDIIEMLQLMPYNFGTIWLPHDAMHATFRSKKSVIDVFRDANLPCKQVPDPDKGSRVFHGINAVRKVLKNWPIEFDAVQCHRGLEALRNYSHKWNVKTQTFSDEPAHDLWSHGADAFRYMCLSITPEDLQRSRERYEQRLIQSRNSINSSIERPQLGRGPVTWAEHMEAFDRMREAELRANRW